MIPNQQDSVSVLNNIDAASTGQFTVDENSLAKIMSVLTNLYSDPEGAVVREYLTNALDSQIERQQIDPDYVWRPIEVTTPSHFSKEYKVRDFGLGMSVDDIKEIYSKYGKSTKESSNAVTGMLGLGSKCALTYTGQFTITGYKNGVRCRAVVSKDENDIPIFMIVDTRGTTEPDGVEIAVPVRDRNSFEQKTSEFLRWWKPGQVLVNGREPVYHSLTLVKSDPITFNIAGKDVTEDVEIYLIERDPNRYYGVPTSYVVMGNVPYAVDSDYVDSGLNEANMGFAAYVPMGAIDFPPSREKLFYNARSKEAIRKISHGLFEAIVQEKIDEISKAPDFKTAWKVHNSLPHHFANHTKMVGLTYKGHAFPNNVNHNHIHLKWNYNGHGEVTERQSTYMQNLMGGTLVVTGVKTKPTSYFKKKVKFYMESNAIDASTATLVDDDIDSVWLDWLPRVDADTIKNLKLPKTPGVNTQRAEPVYDYYHYVGVQVTADNGKTVPCPTGKTIAYISPSDTRDTYRKSGISDGELLGLLGEDYVLVVLSANRFEKFRRLHPNAIHVAKALKERVESLVKATTDTERILGSLDYAERNFLKRVDASKLDDPELVDLAKAVQSKNAATMNYQTAANIVNMARRASVYLDIPEMKKANSNPLKRYPLIAYVGDRQVTHMVVYCNAVYDATLAGTI